MKMKELMGVKTTKIKFQKKKMKSKKLEPRNIFILQEVLIANKNQNILMKKKKRKRKITITKTKTISTIVKLMKSKLYLMEMMKTQIAIQILLLTFQDSFVIFQTILVLLHLDLLLPSSSSSSNKNHKNNNNIIIFNLL